MTVKTENIMNITGEGGDPNIIQVLIFIKWVQYIVAIFQKQGQHNRYCHK